MNSKKSTVRGYKSVNRTAKGSYRAAEAKAYAGKAAGRRAAGSAKRQVRPAGHAAVNARKRQNRKKRRGVSPALIALAVFTLAVAGAGIALMRPVGDAVPVPEVTLVPQATVQPTPEPTAQPTPEPTPEPTAQPTPEPTPFAYLPIVYRAEGVSAKQIAITVDDCFQVQNLATIVQLAENNGGKLTLFPIGQNISKEGMPKLLQHCAFDLDFEIENHTWSHARIFRLPEEEMAAEIWKQHAALNQALGVDYQEHFLRLMGGDGGSDQRIHGYLNQLGYLGIANWSVSGSDSDMKHIKAALAPGQIYLFHTTDPDTEKLKEFIPWAVSQGYELVTMNELLGLPANEISALTDQEMPEPAAFEDDYHTIKLDDYTWTVLQMQETLRAEGYLVMDGASTGYYGKQTAKAVSAYQKDHGLPVTGEADEATQKMILGEG